MRPLQSEYAPFYESYVSKVLDDDLVQAMHSSLGELKDILISIPVEKADHAYESGKWTVKQLLQHVIDAERVFSYRAVCVARGEQHGLPSFDENSYAALAEVDHRQLQDMKEELLALRSSVYLMFKGFTPDMLLRVGVASGTTVSANALGYIIIGHARHHVKILRERYGI